MLCVWKSVRCRMTNHKAIASNKVHSLANQWLSGGIFIFNGGEQLFEARAKTFGIEIPLNFSRTTKRDHAGFFAHDDDNGVRLLTKSQSCAMAQTKVTVQISALCDRKNTGSSEKPVLAENQATVVERRSLKENGYDKFNAQKTVELYPAFRPGLQWNVPFDGDERPQLAIGEVKG